MLMSRYRLCRRVSEVATGEATVVPAGSRAPASSELVRRLVDEPVDAWAIWWRKKQIVLVWSDGSRSAAASSRTYMDPPVSRAHSFFAQTQYVAKEVGTDFVLTTTSRQSYQIYSQSK